MNGDCRPRGRDEWSGTRGGNGGETRARRILRERKLKRRGKEGERADGREGGRRAVSRRQSPSTVAGVTTG